MPLMTGVHVNTQEARPFLAARRADQGSAPQAALVALPTAYSLAVQVESVAAGIASHVENARRQSWERHKMKLALTFCVMRDQYHQMMKCRSMKHKFRQYMNKQQVIESLQAAELLLSEALTAKSFRELLNRYCTYVDGHSRTSFFRKELEKLSIQTTESESSAALLELLKIFVCFALLAEPPSLDVEIGVTSAEAVARMGWDESRDINCEKSRQWLIEGVQHSQPLSLFKFDIERLQRDEILRHATIFFKGFDGEERTLETRALGCYREMLSLIIADLKNKVDNLTSLQNKLLSAITTLVFATISFIFNQFARDWLEGNIVDVFAKES